MKACFMGLGYIGLPTAIIAAKHGVQVTGVDINPQVVEMTNQGHLHIVEPGMEEMLQEVLGSGALKASTTPEVSDAYFMVVPTPFKGNHEPDVSYVEAATRAVLPYLKAGDLYVIESTSPIGTTEMMAEIIFNERPELKGKIYVAYCPERVLPGNVIYELVHNDRVIGGLTPESTEKAIAFYSQFVQGTLHRTNARTAEMCKLTENSSRDVQIAFANELSLICDKAGINVWELIELANKHPRVNILQPGPGVGGHCISVDPWFLVGDYPSLAKVIDESMKTNDSQPDYVLNRIHEIMKENNITDNRRVGLYGLTYKENVDDCRESPTLQLLESQEKHLARPLKVYDPFIKKDIVENQFHDLNTFLNDIDMVVIMVKHDEIKQNMDKLKGKVILDCHNICTLPGVYHL